MFMNTLTKTVDTYENWYADYLACPYEGVTFDDLFDGILIPVIWDGFEWIEKP